MSASRIRRKKIVNFGWEKYHPRKGAEPIDRLDRRTRRLRAPMTLRDCIRPLLAKRFPEGGDPSLLSRPREHRVRADYEQARVELLYFGLGAGRSFGELHISRSPGLPTRIRAANREAGAWLAYRWACGERRELADHIGATHLRFAAPSTGSSLHTALILSEGNTGKDTRDRPKSLRRSPLQGKSKNCSAGLVPLIYRRQFGIVPLQRFCMT